MEKLSVKEVFQYLKESISDIGESVIDSFKKHKIQLNEEHLRELAPLLGDRIKIKLLSDALN